MLITPALDLTGYTSVLLKFDRYFTHRYGDAVTVEASTNGGSSWTTIKELLPNEDWTTEYVDLSAFAGNSNVLVAFCYTDNGYWASGAAVDDVEIYQPSGFMYSLFYKNFYPFVCAGEPFNIELAFVNLSSSAVTSFDVDYYLSGTPVISKSYSGMNLTLLDTFNFEQGFYLQNPGIYDFSAVITSTNSSEPVNCDTVRFRVFALNECKQAGVLLEENTATWCGYCPEGDYFLDSIKNVFWGSVYPVSIHYGDALSFDDGNKLINAYFYTYPTLMINRWKYDEEPYVFIPNMYDWQTFVEGQLNRKAPFDIQLTGDYDEANRIFSLHADYIANGNLTGNYSVNLYVVEEEISAEGNSNLYQANSYDNISSSHFYGAGNPIQDYTHKFVLRYLYGGVWGYSGIIPDTMEYGDVAGADFVVIVPSGWNEDKLLVYAVVEFTGENSVYDRNIVAVSGLKMVNSNETLGLGNRMKIFPNPADKYICVLDDIMVVDAMAYDVSGKTINLSVHSNIIDVSNLQNGVYILVLEDRNGGKYFSKFVKK